MLEPMPRRSFLGKLAALPLIGGSVSLLGAPTAVAEPVTTDLLEAYKTWLEYERRFLSWEMAADPVIGDFYSHHKNGGTQVGRFKAIERCFAFIGDSGSYHVGSDNAPASTRAALVLSTVGCSWREESVVRRSA